MPQRVARTAARHRTTACLNTRVQRQSLLTSRSSLTRLQTKEAIPIWSCLFFSDAPAGGFTHSFAYPLEKVYFKNYLACADENRLFFCGMWNWHHTEQHIEE